MSDDTIAIPNHHVPSCGKFPEWAKDRPRGSYFGYFENEHGEQWIILITKESIRMAGGDCGWDNVDEIKVDDWSRIQETLRKRPSKWNLSSEESSWAYLNIITAAQKFKHR